MPMKRFFPLLMTLIAFPACSSVSTKEPNSSENSQPLNGTVISHYRCTLKAGKQKYEAQDRTLADAQSHVRSLCLKDGTAPDACHVDHVSCTGF